MKLNDLTPNSSQAGETLTPAFYLQLLQHFVETGSYEAALPYREDALTAYLIETMADPVITAQVLSDEVSARVFLDTHIQFVALCLKKAQYRLQRTTAERHQIKEAEQWSLSKREAGWRALLAQVDEEYGEDGFERTFFEQELNTEEGGVADDGKWTYFQMNGNGCYALVWNRKSIALSTNERRWSNACCKRTYELWPPTFKTTKLEMRTSTKRGH